MTKQLCSVLNNLVLSNQGLEGSNIFLISRKCIHAGNVFMFIAAYMTINGGVL